MCSLEQRDNLFILTLTGPTPNDEHRLNPGAISSILASLRRATSLSTPGSVLITTSSGKFFSNGFDLKYAQSTPSPHHSLHLMVESLRPVIAALIALPMPTIAAINGHAAAAGLILALSHDYVIVNGGRGILYMPEVDIGLTLPDYFDAVMREKVKGGTKASRELGLWGRKFKGREAAEMGVVDEAVTEGGEEGVRRRAEEKAAELAKRKWDGGVYAELRKGLLFREVCDVLGLERKAVVAATVPTAQRSKM